MSVSLEECLEMQLSEVSLLMSMFSEKEITLIDPCIITDIERFVHCNYYPFNNFSVSHSLHDSHIYSKIIIMSVIVLSYFSNLKN